MPLLWRFDTPRLADWPLCESEAISGRFLVSKNRPSVTSTLTDIGVDSNTVLVGYSVNRAARLDKRQRMYHCANLALVCPFLETRVDDSNHPVSRSVCRADRPSGFHRLLP
jgi:hypothetical protein